MAKRLPDKSPTREERREAWVKSVAQASRSLLDAAFDDVTFREQYRRTLLALIADETAGTSSPEAIGLSGELLQVLYRFVQPADRERAEHLLAVQLIFDVERSKGASESQALETARIFRPDRWPISTQNPAYMLDTGDIVHPASLNLR